MFVTTNRYHPLTTNDNIENISTPSPPINNTDDINDVQTPKIKLLPPIFVRDLFDFARFRNILIESIGPENFILKSSSNVIKIQTANPDSYRKTIHLLIGKEGQYHTYQSHEGISFRINVRNLLKILELL
jgi:hypothetical protein